jgi:lipoprotein NlpI
VQAARQQPRGEWPRPALALAHGLLTVEETLAEIDRKKGDDREMALAEGYFYIGQYYMTRGDRTQAAEYFRKVRKLGVTMYIEHIAAGAELTAMGQPKD